MSQATEPPESDHADKFLLVDQERDNEKEFDTWENAQEQMNELVEMGADPDDFRIKPVDADETDEIDMSENGDTPDRVEAEVVDEPDTAPATLDELPEITSVEGTAKSIINQLDHADMTRLVWDPEASSQSVPYDPGRLPYNRPEPSAEAFDMFATIIEGAMDVRYSVVDVEFEQTDQTLGCTVTIEKQTETGTKRLVGVKTRTNTNLDHWRERLYSKARRNALKQDIPPTWVSALLRKYKRMETHA